MLSFHSHTRSHCPLSADRYSASAARISPSECSGCESPEDATGTAGEDPSSTALAKSLSSWPKVDG